jgi:transcriptional regulator with XRE-family HTH domain
MIGKRIKEYRKKKGLTQKELCKLIGISQGGLSEIESEKINPSSETLLGFISHTDINLSWLFTGEGPMEATGVMYTEQGYTPLDDISQKILILLKDMPEEDRREILKNIEEKKLLKELLEERKRLKEAG